MPTTTERGALRMREVAAYLGCSRDTADRLWQRGELRSWTIGTARFVSVAELQRFIAEREAQAEARA
ncbi:MAG: helix-turn-helix domain-containing protein [Dehalococcoidia bacterium]|nr:helix-turn-helix domain-containing protein [Dehalococcoidia bacterium]